MILHDPNPSLDQEVNSLEGKVTDEIVVAAGPFPIKIIKSYININTTVTNILPHSLLTKLTHNFTICRCFILNCHSTFDISLSDESYVHPASMVLPDPNPSLDQEVNSFDSEGRFANK